MAVSVTGTVSVAPITADDDVRGAAEFLQVNLNQRVSADQWEYAVDVPWAVESPNAGFMLLDDDEIVGVQLAFYSERTIHGRCERFCNLGAWCVLPAYRFHSLRLLKAALGQTGYHFTDLSPSGNVVGINAKLGFRFLDTTTALVPNIPWPSWPGRDVISSDPELIERTLTGRELQIHRDHVAAHGDSSSRSDPRRRVVLPALPQGEAEGAAAVREHSLREQPRALAGHGPPARAPSADSPRHRRRCWPSAESSATGHDPRSCFDRHAERCSTAPIWSRLRSTTSTANWSAWRGERGPENKDASEHAHATPSPHRRHGRRPSRARRR